MRRVGLLHGVGRAASLSQDLRLGDQPERRHSVGLAYSGRCVGLTVAREPARKQALAAKDSHRAQRVAWSGAERRCSEGAGLAAPDYRVRPRRWTRAARAL